MKKRKNVILSAITCFVSICMLMLGVYAASNPSLSIGGQVSYTARDAKVLVQGKVNGAKDSTTGAQMATVNYPATTTLTANDVTATKVTNSSTQYLDYTAGTGNSESDDLSPWNIGTLEFAEDSTGVKDITISFKLTNLSTYPVQATLTFPSGATDSDLASANVSRTANVTSLYLAQNGGSGQLNVIYKLTNDSQNIPAGTNNLLGMNIAFAKTAPQKANSVSAINANGGKVTMGKKSDQSTTEDVQWKCFAYSTDGNTWTKLESGASIPTTAKYGYFVLDTYVSSLSEQVFLNGDKYDYDETTSSTARIMRNYWYIKAGVNGVTTANTVLANDYYYSDIRQTLKGIETTLSISADNEIYSAIQGRTMEDLYKLNSAKWDSTDEKWDTSDQSAPTGADMTQVDKFWLMSVDEVATYFYNDTALALIGRYWLRTPVSVTPYYSNLAYYVESDKVYYKYSVNCSDYARAAFKLELE